MGAPGFSALFPVFSNRDRMGPSHLAAFLWSLPS